MLAAALLVTMVTAAQQQGEAYPSYIEVTGTAEREIAPDEIYLSITISERDSKGRITVEQQYGEMVAALRGAGIDVEQRLKVVDLTSSFFRKRTSVATAQYELKLGSSAEVARAWQTLDGQGISQVTVSKVSHSRLSAYKAEVRADAMRAARDNAASLAEAIDQRIGRCFYIYDSNSSVMPTFYAANRMVKTRAAGIMEDAVAEDAMEELEFQTIKLQYRVQAKFVLE